MKNNLLKFYTSAFFICASIVTYGQPGTQDGSGPGNLEGNDAEPASIDNYVLIFAIIGIVYVYFNVNKFKLAKK